MQHTWTGYRSIVPPLMCNMPCLSKHVGQFQCAISIPVGLIHHADLAVTVLCANMLEMEKLAIADVQEITTIVKTTANLRV